MQEADKINTDKNALCILARDMGVDFVDLDLININKNAASVLDYDIAKRYSVVPFDIKNSLLYLAMQNPDDIFLIDEIKVFTQMEIKPFLADFKQIERVINCLCGGEAVGGSKAAIYPEEQGATAIAEDGRAPSGQDYCTECNNLTLPQEYPLLDEFVEKAFKLNASRVIVEVCAGGIRVLYKAEGSLVKEDHFNELQNKSVVQKLKEVSLLYSISYFRMFVDEREIAIKVSHLPVSGGDRYVLNISTCLERCSINELGLTQNEQNTIQCMLKKKSGLIIVTGPRGSGRTSTCHAMLEIAAADSSILIIEDKANIRLERASRIETCGKSEAEVIDLIKSADKHDPDILFIDTNIGAAELKLLVNMALSGKLIIVVMSFSSIFSTIAGLINMEIKPFVAAAALNGIVSQRLIRRLCPDCRGKGIKPGIVIRRSGGRGESPICDTCEGKGFKGRTGIFEVFRMNREYRQLLLKNDSLDMFLSCLKNERSTFANNYLRMINDEMISTEDLSGLSFEEDSN